MICLMARCWIADGFSKPGKNREFRQISLWLIQENYSPHYLKTRNLAGIDEHREMFNASADLAGTGDRKH